LQTQAVPVLFNIYPWTTSQTHFKGVVVPFPSEEAAYPGLQAHAPVAVLRVELGGQVAAQAIGLVAT